MPMPVLALARMTSAWSMARLCSISASTSSTRACTRSTLLITGTIARSWLIAA
jgi:hypothetical protein